ncbi:MULTISPECIES: organic hydroperoxide resistance protein [unclassified Oceanobacillus]|uniref:organic hydroperoxide resistance protein n=1 Tax=unclassified Oceanobacillus TaxID=2630292 RepID=UPI0012EC8BA2|nr:organic hydroperoxide resistance protein [Oceanobacillus sp. AG]
MSDVLFTSSATAKNGREGHVKSSDGILDLELVNPLQDKNGKGSNPEQLFAAGYSACFDGALNLIASKKDKRIDSETTAEVSFMKDESDGGNKIGVTLKVKISGVSPEDAEELVQAAHQACPYSKATRGNVDVKLVPQAVE